jgi:hypothetical protein
MELAQPLATSVPCWKSFRQKKARGLKSPGVNARF